MTDDRHFFEDIADHVGAAYLRYSFTKGTEQEVGFLVERLELAAGARVLDVGCGPGRHALALARRGIEVVGVDISERFVALAAEAAEAAGLAGAARFERGDARRLPYTTEFDAVLSLCQGGFGSVGGPGADPAPIDPDGVVLQQMAGAVRNGGLVAFSAFNAYFQVRWLEEADRFDVDRGVNHERATVKDSDGVEAERDLWTSCFTPRELRLLVDRADLTLDDLYGVQPGAYRAAPPRLDLPEYLVVAHR